MVVNPQHLWEPSGRHRDHFWLKVDGLVEDCALRTQSSWVHDRAEPTAPIVVASSL